MQVHLEFELDGNRHELDCSDSEPLLNAILRAGIDAPHSCRAGECGSCMCTLVSGEVRLRNNDVLNKDELAAGWILACQAIPLTAQVKIKFPD